MWDRRLHSFRNREFDRMRVADFQVDELLAGEGRRDGRSGRFDCGSIPYADETQDRGVSFGDAEDVVVEVGAGCAWVN